MLDLLASDHFFRNRDYRLNAEYHPGMDSGTIVAITMQPMEDSGKLLLDSVTLILSGNEMRQLRDMIDEALGDA